MSAERVDAVRDTIVDIFRTVGECVGRLVAEEMIDRGVWAHVEPQSDPLPPALLNMRDAAAYLGIGRTSLYDLVVGNELPRVMVAGRPKFRRTDLDKFVTKTKSLYGKRSPKLRCLRSS
jgi:excisionase family DNA binding protein